MSWYYADNNERLGPIDESGFQALISSGRIKPDTLVWREGMANWQPLAEVGPGNTEPMGGSLHEGRVGVAAPAAVCAQCGTLLPTDEMVRFEDRFVCASCKPIFFQKVKEGASFVGDRVYAGFWVRFLALFLDGILAQIVLQLFSFLLMRASGQGADELQGVLMGISVVFQVAYEVYFVGRYGATPGKMALKLKVIRADGSPVGYGLAAGRYLARILSGITLGIGFIMAAFDEEKRTLHDRICDTRVVRE